MTKFRRAKLRQTDVERTREEIIAQFSDDPKIDVKQLLEEFDEDVRLAETWLNNKYQVSVRRFTGLIHLSIKRIDKEPIHDWRDLQKIKNELVGQEHEAVELYPAESRLVDSANQFHLWCLPESGMRFPFGFNERFVTDKPFSRSKQRPFIVREDD